MNVSSDDVSNLKVQRALAETWKQIDPGTVIRVERTIEEAVRWCRTVAKGEGDIEVVGAGEGSSKPVSVLVTGSVHLVGGVLEVLDG